MFPNVLCCTGRSLRSFVPFVRGYHISFLTHYSGVGERVLYHSGPLVYNAKCVRTTITNNSEVLYNIEYNGISGSCSRWVSENQLRKCKKMNRKISIRKRAVRRRCFMFELTTTGCSSEEESDSAEHENDITSPLFKDRSLINQANALVADLPQQLTKIHVIIPHDLISILILDGEMVTEKHKLLHLPASLSVDELLKQYLDVVRKSHVQDGNLITTEICRTIRKYFNLTLGTKLLYKMERKQYQTLLKGLPGLPMSKIYGSTHLLRLFTKISDILNCDHLEVKLIYVIQKSMHEFVKYMFEQKEKLFGISFYSSRTEADFNV